MRFAVALDGAGCWEVEWAADALVLSIARQKHALRCDPRPKSPTHPPPPLKRANLIEQHKVDEKRRSDFASPDSTDRPRGCAIAISSPAPSTACPAHRRGGNRPD
ncbi:hypothetical protein THAOC_00552 [Thalassiosira oceanica]|uniref:Uncharacterized protein n=1 Tax=Thalassiosira oceanica TaxID=159749 RepID=K0TFT8_THAOC|nr:hypothetical protein THAOC_00552 [Thalassiosira oceanica]|eukprot:EJK77603.1 hypothetical protein THAOC_00552 [Thalassiosira oceanica]